MATAPLRVEFRGRGVVARLLPRAAFCVFALITGLWLTQAWTSPPKDWLLYHDTARLLLAGRIGELYPGSTPGLPFFYPPFFVWQLAPLGLVPRGAAHACVVAAMLVCLAIALWSLRATLDRRRGPVEQWLWVVLSSAGFTWMVVVGHISAWYLMLISLALLAWMRGAPVLAGLALAMVLSKPHYGLAILLVLAAARRWRMVAGAAAGALLLIASSLPLGPGAWRAWLAVLGQAGAIPSAAPAWKQISVRGAWLSLVDAPRADLLWLLTAVPLVALACWACWRAGGAKGREHRVLGLGVLVAIACSPYAFQYDGLLLALPGLSWYFRPADRGPRARVAGAMAIAACYVFQHLSGWVLQRGVALAGFAAAAWLAIDAHDLLRGPASPRSNGLRVSRPPSYRTSLGRSGPVPNQPQPTTPASSSTSSQRNSTSM